MTHIRMTALVLLVLVSVTARALGVEGVDQLIARANSAPPGSRPGLYLQIARQQADAADKFYQAGNAESGNTALNDVLTYSQKATDAAASTGKKLKDTEIGLRKMSERFRDVKHNLPFDDQAPVQQAIDRLEKMRTYLLSEMFGKKTK